MSIIFLICTQIRKKIKSHNSLPHHLLLLLSRKTHLGSFLIKYSELEKLLFRGGINQIIRTKIKIRTKVTPMDLWIATLGTIPTTITTITSLLNN